VDLGSALDLKKVLIDRNSNKNDDDDDDDDDGGGGGGGGLFDEIREHF
jgi:hypothetical protein